MKRKKFIQDILFTMGIITGSKSFAMVNDDPAHLQIRMIYNNTGSDPGFVNEWGLSVWMEQNNHAVLFDTGGNPEVFKKNFEVSGADPARLGKIVISHNHWDHVNGLPVILEKTGYRPEVYVPAADLEHFRANFPKARLTGVESAVKIDDYLWSTGQMVTDYRDQRFYEQSLIIDHQDQLILLTGCAHPGIVSIVEKTLSLFPGRELSLVAGGFHLGGFGEEKLREILGGLKDLKVAKLAASHCTGDQAIQFLKKDWGNRFVEFNNGDILNI